MLCCIPILSQFRILFLVLQHIKKKERHSQLMEIFINEENGLFNKNALSIDVVGGKRSFSINGTIRTTTKRDHILFILDFV